MVIVLMLKGLRDSHPASTCDFTHPESTDTDRCTHILEVLVIVPIPKVLILVDVLTAWKYCWMHSLVLVQSCA